MDTCKSCTHCKFDELWGEYKCLKHGHRIYSLSERSLCEFYSEDKTKKGGSEDE